MNTVPPESPELLEVPCREATQKRLDVFLADSVTETSRSVVQRAIRDGWVRVNGNVVQRPSRVVHIGDNVQWHRVPVAPMVVEPERIPLDIVFEDSSLLVVNKPAGMPVHPGPGHSSGTLVNALLHHAGTGPVKEDSLPPVGLSSPYEARGSIRPGIVHRLDMNTTGLLVVAKNDAIHRGLAKQFEMRTILRQYVGIVRGRPKMLSGTIDAALGRHPRDRKKMAVRSDGKRAVTTYHVEEDLYGAALVKFKLQTGRTHQIRVHACHIGHPVLGDPSYGEPMPGLTRQALHAELLGFVHPLTRADAVFRCDIPADMVRVLQQLRV